MLTQCQNCSTSIQGDYCVQCGQSAADLDLPVGEFAKEFASEAFSLDSRLRLTLGPLFLKPGAVPLEYVAGRRARFVPPMRLYIVASFAMFVILGMGPGLTVSNVTTSDDVAEAVDSVASSPGEAVGVESAEPSEESFVDRLTDRLESGLAQTRANGESFSREFMNRLAQAMIFLLPAFALLLKLVYRGRLYVHHIVFAVYLHSFVFFVVSFAGLPEALRLPPMFDLLGIVVLSIPLYLLLGMKRFYDESWVRTFAKFVFVSVTYGIVGVTALIATLVVALLTF